MKKYQVSIFGFGCEIVYGILTKDQVNFWTDENKLEEAGFEEPHSALYDYLWDREEYEHLVPEEAQIQEEWHDLDNIAHGYGPTTGAYIIVNELDENGSVVKEIFNNSVEQILNDNNHTQEEVELDSTLNHVFFAISVEKGGYYDATVEDEKFDINKLKFNISEYPNGDSLIEGLMYSDTEIELDPSTTGKSFDLEILDLSDVN